jgi:hypothetical protein
MMFNQPGIQALQKAATITDKLDGLIEQLIEKHNHYKALSESQAAEIQDLKRQLENERKINNGLRTLLGDMKEAEDEVVINVANVFFSDTEPPDLNNLNLRHFFNQVIAEYQSLNTAYKQLHRTHLRMYDELNKLKKGASDTEVDDGDTFYYLIYTTQNVYVLLLAKDVDDAFEKAKNSGHGSAISIVNIYKKRTDIAREMIATCQPFIDIT